MKVSGRVVVVFCEYELLQSVVDFKRCISDVLASRPVKKHQWHWQTNINHDIYCYVGYNTHQASNSEQVTKWCNTLSL